MEIRIITCHDVNNFGASLQAYALQTYLKSIGHNVKIIDYVPSYQNQGLKWSKIPKDSKYYKTLKNKPILKFCYELLKTISKWRYYLRTIPFRKFKNKYLSCTEHYKTIQELKENPPKADLYIAGSDQIWNTRLKNGSDPAFYMDFGDKMTRRISYAASLGIPFFYEEYTEFVKSELEKLDSISVREESGKKAIIALNISKSIEVVVDPVFLLSKLEWQKFVQNNNNNKPYIFVYDIYTSDKKIEEYAKKVQKETGYRLIAINDCNLVKYADLNKWFVSPIDFISMLANSEFVISNSFHATAFSVIFNKPFATIFNDKANVRMTNFLQEIGLIQCMNPTVLLDNSSFHWRDVNNKISKLIKSSKDFLIQNIQ